MNRLYNSLAAAVVGVSILAGCYSGGYTGSRMRDFTGTILASRSGGDGCPSGIEYHVQVDKDFATSPDHSDRFGSRIVLCQNPPADGTVAPLNTGARYGFLGMVQLSSDPNLPQVVPPFDPTSQRALPLYELKGLLTKVKDDLNDIAEHR